MQIKAKFRCNSITDNGYNKSAQFTAIYGDQGENKDFAQATPCGSVQIAIDKDTPASNFFQPQKDYYLYFEAVPE